MNGKRKRNKVQNEPTSDRMKKRYYRIALFGMIGLFIVAGFLAWYVFH